MGRERLALLQLCDSLFPVGSFAHSDGLETAVASGLVSTGSNVRDWLHTVLTVTLASSELPAVQSAMRAASACDLQALGNLDDEVDAMRPSAAGRAATRTMGTRLMKTWQQIRPSDAVGSALAARPRYTFPVAFGIVCCSSGIGTPDAMEGYCYSRLAASVSAAMRLMPLGQHEAHGLLADVLGAVPGMVGQMAAVPASPRSFAPMMDIAAMSHQYVHSRLFRS
jgi:urease accessory protein